MAASYHRSYSSTDQVGEEGDNVKGSSLPYHSLNLAEGSGLHEGTTLKRYQVKLSPGWHYLDLLGLNSANVL